MRAVDSLSLEIPEGSVFALVGANGAGKTSTIMAIAGHVDIPGGTILFEGKDITVLPACERVRAGIALAPEGRRLFPDLSVAENLEIGGYSRSRAAVSGTRAMVYELFPRLRERARQSAASLSGGEQQMLAIGRALMAEPRLLMVDEISLGLMPKMVDLCYAAIERLCSGRLTVLLVEQSTSRARGRGSGLCPRVRPGGVAGGGERGEGRPAPDRGLSGSRTARARRPRGVRAPRPASAGSERFRGKEFPPAAQRSYSHRSSSSWM